MHAPRRGLVLVAALALAAGCRDQRPSGPSGAPSVGATGASSATAVPPAPKAAAPVREGGAVVRAADEPALYVADEDRDVVRQLPLPVDVHTPPVDVKMPGPPVQALALAGRVLVTVRGVRNGDAVEAPGLLLILERDGSGSLHEAGRIEVPADAWGLAVTPDERVALVTSAWTHRVSAIDLESKKKLWSVDVPREPRGVVVLPDGKSAYVTHLTRASLTRIDDLAGTPRTRTVSFPAAPLRTPAFGTDRDERAEAATLGYAPVLSPDGGRLFVARQALGAVGKRAWNGQATVDVLITADESGLALRPTRELMMWSEDFMKSGISATSSTTDMTMTGPGLAQDEPPFVAARAALYRRATRTLLVASEGTDALVELDALSIDPSAKPLRTYRLGGEPQLDIDEGFAGIQPRLALEHAWAKAEPGQTRCGAPSGVALSADETTAWVFCRSTDELAIVTLEGYDKPVARRVDEPPIPTVSLGHDPLPEQAALGRKLFYDARDPTLSGRFACAGCHPDGRDDGHVWHEDESAQDVVDFAPVQLDKATGVNLHAFAMTVHADPVTASVTKGAPRQTPMLAGRVSASGPYGWKSLSSNLRHRVVTGFMLHRWGPDGYHGFGMAIGRADALAEFLRKGLVPPPHETRDLSAEEERGRTVFQDPNVGCASCHVPNGGEYTNRAAVGIGEWAYSKLVFDPEKTGTRFKTPSLRFVAGTAPYFHDGSVATLEDLIERNGKRMGYTDHLSKEDRAALVAFLKTL